MLRRVGIGIRHQEDIGGVVRIRREHLRAVDDPAVAVTHRARLAGGDVRAAFGLGITQAEPEVAGQRALEHFLLKLG